MDRSGAYAARHLAKNVVAAGLAERCQVQVAYAIGVAEPVSINVELTAPAKVPERRIVAAIREVADMTPQGIIDAPGSAQARLPADGGLRALRPRGRGFHLGAP